ncbi:MAG: succinate dehydrogenase [Anaerolineales bacterium]|nr:succinate dehydrogenase [Anaerolineales bacterium]
MVKRRLRIRPNFEVTAWKYMRLSAILLVPLVWFHTIFTTLVVGAENVNLSLVAQRWGTVGWRIYDILLLIFAFSHGMNGLRQIVLDFTSSSLSRKLINLLLLLFWLALSLAGAVGILGGVRK